MAKEKILVVDDERAINKLVCSYLAKEQFIPLSAYNGEEALYLIEKENPDLIILDVMLPDTEGPDLSLEIRKESDAPIIFLSCKTQEIDKIIALSAGGDDYMTKPFMPGELIARIKAHLRRQKSLVRNFSETQTGSVYEFEGLKIDFEAREIFVDGEEVNLTAKEFDIVKLLVENPERSFPPLRYSRLCGRPTAWKTIKDCHGLHKHHKEKLERRPDSPGYIVSVRGVGYKFNHALSKNENDIPEDR